MLKENLNKLKHILKDADYNQFILFGTDWPMGLALYKESNYTKVYKDALRDEADLYNRFFSENLATFLFGEDKNIPVNHIEFLNKKYGQRIPLQPWIVKDDSTDGEDVSFPASIPAPPLPR